MYTLFVLFLLVPFSSEVQPQQTICWRSISDQDKFSIDRDDTDALVESQENESETELCKRGIFTCYSLWKEVEFPDNSTALIVIAQGCWEVSGHGYCPEGACVAESKAPMAALKGTVFCCCSGDLCNANLTYAGGGGRSGNGLEVAGVLDGARGRGATPLDDPTAPVPKPSSPTHLTGSFGGNWPGLGARLVVIGSVGVLVVIAVVVGATAIVRWAALPVRGKTQSGPHQRNSHNHRTAPSVDDHRSSDYLLTNLKLEKIVGQGRYGTVWLAHVVKQDHPVAVKMFPLHYSQYYFNEKDIYALPFMDHPSLLTYYGCDETMTKEGVASYALVLSYCSGGTLQDYLKANTIDLTTFCKMALSTSAGLAHLHTEMRSGDKWKPCVTHRDVNTKNILVKSDLTCCLCDLGLGVKITGSHYYTLGEEQHAETKSINDVGTLRYMAPEVLEGAVNLRDCEASLKQIDVYALGLVLWEMATRTSDLYPNQADVPQYALPFEKEVGVHPSLEQMRTAVCRNKARPLFNAEWKHASGSGRLIRETVDDCTDQDGEARLTALCVHERLSSLYRGCLSSGVSSQCGGGGGLLGISPTVNNQTLPLNIHHQIVCNGGSGTLSHQINNNNNSNFTNHNTDNSEHTGDKEYGLLGGTSEGTVETMVTLSPSGDSVASHHPAHNMAQLLAPPPHHQTSDVHNHHHQQQQQDYWLVTMQPHQGRNPCLERNLLGNNGGGSGGGGGGGTGSEEALLSVVHTSSKHINLHPRQQNYRWEPQQPSLPQHNPIPYVQNRPFAVTKRCNDSVTNSDPVKKPSSSAVALLKKPLKKFLSSGDPRKAVKKKKNKSKKDAGQEMDDEGVTVDESGRLILDDDTDNAKAKKKRPSSLRLVSGTDSSTEQSACKPLKEISARVKTPGDLPPSVRKKRARLSLYDDRMMSAATPGIQPPAPPPLAGSLSAHFDSSF